MPPWHPKSPTPLPTNDALRPADDAYPFAFPVLVVRAGRLEPHRDSLSFGLLPADVAASGDVPNLDVFTGAGDVWRTVSVLHVAPTGRKVLGRELGRAVFGVERVERYDLLDLRAVARDTVGNDSDDLWDQTKSHDEVLRKVEGASSFDVVATVLLEAVGQ